jgi:hypothetical protein
MEDEDDNDNDSEFSPEGLMALLAADVVAQSIDCLRPDLAGFAYLFRAHTTPENLALLEAFDAACDRVRAQFFNLEDAKHLLKTI